MPPRTRAPTPVPARWIRPRSRAAAPETSAKRGPFCNGESLSCATGHRPPLRRGLHPPVRSVRNRLSGLGHFWGRRRSGWWGCGPERGVGPALRRAQDNHRPGEDAPEGAGSAVVGVGRIHRLGSFSKNFPIQTLHPLTRVEGVVWIGLVTSPSASRLASFSEVSSSRLGSSGLRLAQTSGSIDPCSEEPTASGWAGFGVADASLGPPRSWQWEECWRRSETDPVRRSESDPPGGVIPTPWGRSWARRRCQPSWSVVSSFAPLLPHSSSCPWWRSRWRGARGDRAARW